MTYRGWSTKMYVVPIKMRLCSTLIRIARCYNIRGYKYKLNSCSEIFNVCCLTTWIIIAEVYSFILKCSNSIRNEKGGPYANCPQLDPAINILSTVQVHTTHSAGFTENSNWAAHLLGPALGMSLVSRRHTVFEFIVRNWYQTHA